MVTRIYVEKKKGFDVEANQIQEDLIQNLGIPSQLIVRLIHWYDVEGLEPSELQSAIRIILSEPNQDHVYPESFTLPEGFLSFAMQYLPGQYDQRADSAAQCVQLLTQGERPLVATGQLIALKGISREELDRIRQYLINPVESREAPPEKPGTLEMTITPPADVERIQGFRDFDEERLSRYYQGMGFAMTLEDLSFCQGYFAREEKRDPSLTELRVIDTYWSDHCRHTTFLTELSEIRLAEGPLRDAVEASLQDYLEKRKILLEAKNQDPNQPITLMDLATFGGKYLRAVGLVPDLDLSEEINACSIEVPVTVNGVKEPWLVQFKNETHNHPTEIEPFGGAATCLGGAIRDPLSGRAYVYQAMRVTGSGDPTGPVSETLPGKLPTRKITTGAAQGYSSYGNQIGLATGQVTELYDPGYAAKRMEIGAVIGASPKSNVRREIPRPGDLIVLLGGATGRDGIGGATGSSKAHTEESVSVCGAEVQKGNAPTERKIQRLFRNPQISRLIKRCNDFGAGGVCVAIGELAPGLTVNLDAVPKKYEGLDGTELAISESQERMAVVLDPMDLAAFQAGAREENLEAHVVARVTEEPRLRMTWRGDRIVDLSRRFLDSNGVRQQAKAVIEAPKGENYRNAVPAVLKEGTDAEIFLKNLARLEVCGQKGLAERFDASIGAATVMMPFAGSYQLTPEDAMVAKIPVLKGETEDATAMSYGFIPGLMRYSPFYGAAYAVVESLSKLCAVGANPLKARLTFQEYFERLREDPKRWGKPAGALLGALAAQLGLELPAIGGKDSMSGSFEEMDVPPTLVSFAVAPTKVRHTCSSRMKHSGGKVLLLQIPEDENHLPDWKKLRAFYKTVRIHMLYRDIVSAAVVREGGAAATVARMCFGEKLGFSFEPGLSSEILYAPKAGSLVVKLSSEAELTNIELLNPILLGFTRDDGTFSQRGGWRIPVDRAIEQYQGTLESVFPNKAKTPEMVPVSLYGQRNKKRCSFQKARPQVLIPCFPGTNCEVDTARAFAKAGARPEILVVQNRSVSDIEESIQRLTQAVHQAQIICFPGGFSGGDEPEGSGKFIATTFRNPRIAEATMALLEKREGLILGICNGFQALMKLGLLPYGEIREIQPDDPTLTYNYLGRHVSRMAYTRITSIKSPWLAGASLGEVFAVPVSHGEGRFVADRETIRRLAENGQIAAQYVDPDGIVCGETEWNPNGSVSAVEGMTSPDGRVFGKMGHSERTGHGLYRNVPGKKDQKIFQSGVRYFS